MKNAEKKKLAQSLYVKGSMLQKEIAQKVGVTPKTLRKWTDDGNWEQLKEAQTITRSQLLQDAFNQLKAINKRIDELGGVPNKELSDAKGVVRKEIELFSSNPVHKYVEVFEDFIDYLSKSSPEHLVLFAGLSNDFIEVQFKKQS